MASKLKQWNLLQNDVNVCTFRTVLCPLFNMKGRLVYCIDVGGIMQKFGYSQRPEEWRQFIDSSKLILKALLNGNMLPSIPVGYAANNIFGIQLF